jgi:trans-2,3-dihydro-3-hydroxyanthranilate isomerase
VAPRPLTWLDVFCDRPLAGNQLCVIHDADGLNDEQMLAIARETNLSETTFIHPATQAGADYRNRIFSPPGEMPFAGHPSLGTAVAHAYRLGVTDATYVQQTHPGLQPVQVVLDGRHGRASMIQAPTEFADLPDPDAVARALGIARGDLRDDLAPQVVSTGARHLMVPVSDAGVLDQLDFDASGLPSLLREVDAICAYVAALATDGATAEARSFYEDRGRLIEDPATGSAAGPLVALADRAHISRDLTICQGVAMGRPSRLHARIEGGRAVVAGDVVVVATGTTVA